MTETMSPRAALLDLAGTARDAIAGDLGPRTGRRRWSRSTRMSQPRNHRTRAAFPRSAEAFAPNRAPSRGSRVRHGSAQGPGSARHRLTSGSGRQVAGSRRQRRGSGFSKSAARAHRAGYPPPDFSSQPKDRSQRSGPHRSACRSAGSMSCDSRRGVGGCTPMSWRWRSCRTW